MARKKKPEEHANHERWLVSYADFITLLFAFFTTLYAISTVDAKKAGKLMFSLRTVFDMNLFSTDKPILGTDSNEPPQISTGARPHLRPIRVQGLPAKKAVDANRKKLIALKGMLANYLGGNNGSSRLVHVRQEPHGIVISLDAGGFFESGSNTVLPKAQQSLDKISHILAEVALPLRIEGHTDNRPIHGKFRSNWELSTSRAVTIVSGLIDHFEYPPNLLSAAGYGDTQPLFSNETLEGRARNRRIDVVVLRDMQHPQGVGFDENAEDDDAKKDDDK